ncbi:MAG: polysaccharide export protein [Deltaproteobacteria bacterium]|nr:polysaccharide export protein [Deltaproteobacteria bacterium]
MRPASRPSRAAVVSVFAASAVLSACATTEELPDAFTWVDELPEEALAPTPYKLRGNDKLEVKVFKQESLSGEVLVREDGQITVPLVGDIAVVGMTPPEASAEIAKRLAGTGFIDNPSVSVAVIETRQPSFAVAGEVRQPGSFELQPGTTVLDGVALAGGLSEFAKKDRVFVIRKAKGNQRVRFNFARVARSDGKGLRFHLEDGDVVVVE